MYVRAHILKCMFCISLLFICIPNDYIFSILQWLCIHEPKIMFVIIIHFVRIKDPVTPLQTRRRDNWLQLANTYCMYRMPLIYIMHIAYSTAYVVCTLHRKIHILIAYLSYLLLRSMQGYWTNYLADKSLAMHWFFHSLSGVKLSLVYWWNHKSSLSCAK